MGLIGTLLMNLKANTVGFDQGMKRSRKHLKRFTQTTKTAQRAVMGLAAAVAAYATVNLVKGWMLQIDLIGKMSDELGIATEDLLAFEHAAKITGSDLVTVHKALEIFTRRIGETKIGVGEMQRVLPMLGLTNAALASVELGEAFRMVAESISKMTSQTDKAYAAYGTFGRQGVRLLNILQLGRKGINRLAADAERLGLTFSRFEVAQVEAANDAIVRLADSARAVGFQFAIGISPYIEAAADAITDFGTKGTGIAGLMVEAFEAVGEAAAATGDLIDNLGRKTAKAQLAFGTALIVATGGRAGVETARQARIRLTETEGPGRAEKFRQFMDKIRADAKQNAENAAKFSKELRKPPALSDALGGSALGVVERLQEQVSLFGKSATAVTDYKLAQLGAAQATREYAASLHEQLTALKDNAAATKKAADAQEDMMERGRRLRQQTRTPAELKVASRREIQDLFNAGAISFGTRIRAAMQLLQGDARPGGAGSVIQQTAARGLGAAPIESKDVQTHQLLRQIKTALVSGGAGGGFSP